MDADLKKRFDDLVSSTDVVLFMKGRRSMPQCGFSATVVQILNGLVSEYQTVNVLEDPTIREGIKQYSNWPTIPQLYVRGEFVGGCDIVREMYASGELHTLLGVTAADVPAPAVTITDAAAEALKGALADAEDGDFIHVSINPQFQTGMELGPRTAADIAAESNGVTLLFDMVSAKRADGLRIDFVSGPMGSGFKIDNPNAPAAVKNLSPKELAAKLDSGEVTKLYDVRTPQERATASIEPSVLFDQQVAEEIAALPKDTPLAFFCHHGQRSAMAGERFLAMGFTRVYNLAGGIDAWSREVDPKVKRY